MNAHVTSAGGGGGGGGKTKNTVYVAGLAPEVNEQQLLDAFVTFGDILEISIPTEPNELQTTVTANQVASLCNQGRVYAFHWRTDAQISKPQWPSLQVASKHRGFAFLTFSNPSDAQDAIDNFDLNELPGYQGRGRYLKCSIAQPDKFGKDGKAGGPDRAVWHSEEWLQQHAVKEGGGDAAVEEHLVA